MIRGNTLYKTIIIVLIFIIALCLRHYFYLNSNEATSNLFDGYHLKSLFIKHDRERYCTFADKNVIRVNRGVNLNERIRNYNIKLDEVRDSIKKINNASITFATKPVSELSASNRDNYLECVSRHVTKLIILDWSNSVNSSNALISKYYGGTVSPVLCEWIRSNKTKAHYEAIYSQCQVIDPSSTLSKLEYIYYNAKPINRRDYFPNNGHQYPKEFYEKPPKFLMYVSILEDAIVDENGDLLNSNGRILLDDSCSTAVGRKFKTNGERNWNIGSPVLDEVFVISHYWSSSHFHRSAESLPRIAGYLEFLRSHPQIKIHRIPSPFTDEMLNKLGITSDRFVNGIVRSKITYVPAATPCGYPRVMSIQLLSLEYKRIFREIVGNVDIVLIQRSQNRRLKQHDDIYNFIKYNARKYRLRFSVFSDSPTPSIVDTARIFSGAKLIVGPHGAALSNTIHSTPGTYVIEFVCNKPHVNLCYKWLSMVLGMRYHGIPSRFGCEDFIDVDVSEAVQVIGSTIARISNSGIK